MVIAVVAVGACSSSGEVDTARAPDPVLADPDRVRFVALGDAGKPNAVHRRVADAMRATCASLGCDFVLLLGDNVYPRGMDAPDDPRPDELIGAYADIAPVYAVLGNHDWADRDAERARWQIRWASGRDDVRMPANAWWMQAGPATFAGIDTNAAFWFGASFQQRWLADVLDRSSSPWKVVLGHHPYYSDGPHGNAGSYEGWSYLPVVSGHSLKSLFDGALCGRADLYLAGHDHTRQLLAAPCGTTLVVSGTGSSATEIVDRGNHPSFARATPGFAWLELSAMDGEIRFFDETGTLEGAFPLKP